MNIIENAEKECAVLGSLFQGIVNEMKVSVHKSRIFETDLIDKNERERKSHLLN